MHPWDEHYSVLDAVDQGTIMDIRGPAEFGRAVEEQRDRLAGIAKVLGLKAAQ